MKPSTNKQYVKIKFSNPSDFIYEPSPVELEMIEDELHIKEYGHPIRRPAVQGVTEMRARIKMLTGQIKKILKYMDEEMNEPDFQMLSNALALFKRERCEARNRLHEYKTQMKSLN